MDLAQVMDKWRSLVSTTMRVRIIQYVGNVLIILGTISFLKMTLINEATVFVYQPDS